MSVNERTARIRYRAASVLAAVATMTAGVGAVGIGDAAAATPAHHAGLGHQRSGAHHHHGIGDDNRACGFCWLGP